MRSSLLITSFPDRATARRRTFLRLARRSPGTKPFPYRTEFSDLLAIGPGSSTPAEETSPARRIRSPSTLDMGASMAGLTVVYAAGSPEHPADLLLRQIGNGLGLLRRAHFTSGLSGTLSSASEYAFATGVTIGGSSPVLAAGSGGSCASSCFSLGFNAFRRMDPTTKAARHRPSSRSASPSPRPADGLSINHRQERAENIVGATFIAGAPATANPSRHRLISN